MRRIQPQVLGGWRGITGWMWRLRSENKEKTVCLARGGVAAVVALLVIGFSAVGQDSAVGGGAGVRGMPSAGGVMDAYRTVDGWVRGWSYPEDVTAIDPEGTSGTGVTVRLGGRVLGRGVSFADDGTSVWRAARRAIVSAREQLPIADDALRAEKELEIAKMLTLEVELAGKLLPWLGGSLNEAALTLEPGLDGIAGRVGERVVGEFPGTMLATGRDPVAGLQVVMGGLDLPPLEPAEVREDHGAAFYRFRSVHVAQVRPGEEAVFLHRGGRVVGYNEVTGRGVRAHAERVARHIIGRERSEAEGGGLRGTYLAHLDRYEEEAAGAREQAVAAYALAVFAGTEALDQELRGEAAVVARRVLDDLRVLLREDPTVHAAWLIAHLRVSAVQGEQAMENPWARAALDVLIGVHNDTETWGAIGGGERSMIAYAMALAARFGNDSDVGERARGVVRARMLELGMAGIAADMPWLGWAALEVAGDGEVAAAEALRQMRGLCAANEVAQSASGDTADLAGGIVFSRGRRRGASWQSLRVVAFLASMLGDERVTEQDEVVREVGALRRQLRFAMQLEAGREESHMYPDPARARGGVRVAVWDQRMPLDAASLALISAGETLRSLEARSGR